MKKYFLISLSLGFGLYLAISACSNKPVGNVDANNPSEPRADINSLVDGNPNHLISQARQLTFNGNKSGEGYFSPDGKKMIFQSEREPGNPFYQMYVMDLQTGQSTRVSPGIGKTTCGWIHPSMKKVLFSSTHLDPDWKKKSSEEYESRKKTVKGRYAWSFDENFDIFTSDLNGQNIKRLTHEKGYDAEASYSPDGEWIAFASNRAGYNEKLSEEDQKYFNQDPSYMMDIYIMKADGTQVKRLTNTKGYDGGPFFSADGKKITWRRFAPNGMTAEIYTMNVDGSDQRPVTHLKSMSWAPYFHPSGDYIIFTSSVYGFSNFELFIVDTLGLKKPVRVTFNDDFDGLPVFTPDGNQLSWTQRNAKGESQIFIADWDDTLARKLLDLPPRVQIHSQLNPQINTNDLKSWIQYLTSPEMQGRKTGSAAEKAYTQVIADEFKHLGFVGLGENGSFFHRFEFVSGVSLGAENSLEVVGSFKRKYRLSQDFEPLSFSQNGTFKEAPIVFAGYGIKAPATDHSPAYDSYKNLDVQGKWVLVLTHFPQDIKNERRLELNTYARLQHKITVAKNEGAAGIIFTNGPLSEIKESFGKLKYEGSLASSSLPVLKMSSATASELMTYAGKDFTLLQSKLDKGDEDVGFTIPSVYLKAQVDLKFEKSQGINVVAKLPVTGAKSAIMLGAHADHLGRGDVGNSLAKPDEVGQIHFGADDNASGVAGVIELAQYYSDLKKNHPNELKKEIAVGVWSGEEIGILGSTRWIEGYEKQNKKKLNQYVQAYLNMDMIGRLREKLYVQGVGSGDYWKQIVEEVAIKTNMNLSVQEDPYLPTDSMAFYLAEIPTVSFFTGAHAEYHSPRDTAELINFTGLQQVLNTVQKFTQILSDTNLKMVNYVKVAGNAQNKLQGRSFHIFLGTIPDYSQEGIKGVKISGVSKDSPAELAGLREKDIIVEFAGTKIENLYDYVYTLQSVKANSPADIKVLRNNQLQTFKIIPKLKD